MKSSIDIIKSKNKGKTVAIIGGIHGNEPSGISVLNKLRKFKIQNGKLFLILGNPKAAEKKVRFTEKDLNRCFLKNKNKDYESARARQIMKILDKCDAVLDLHNYGKKWSEKTHKPFIICEKNSIELAKKLGISNIFYNWKKYQKGGTDHYMDTIGKIGICLECGPSVQTKKGVNIGYRVSKIFLKELGLIKNAPKVNPKNIRVNKLNSSPISKDNSLRIKI